MNIELNRTVANAEATLGVVAVDGEVLCFSLEDQAQPSGKVAGETRVPAGIYPIRVRRHGGLHARYEKRFDWHRGMLEIANVPEFTDVLIHIGNTDDDTAGCVLTGLMASLDPPWKIQRSTDAYERLYRRAIDAAQRGDLVIAIRDPAGAVQ